MDVLTEHPDILNIEAFVLYPAKENRQNYPVEGYSSPKCSCVSSIPPRTTGEIYRLAWGGLIVSTKAFGDASLTTISAIVPRLSYSH